MCVWMARTGPPRRSPRLTLPEPGRYTGGMIDPTRPLRWRHGPRKRWMAEAGRNADPHGLPPHSPAPQRPADPAAQPADAEGDWGGGYASSRDWLLGSAGEGSAQLAADAGPPVSGSPHVSGPAAPGVPVVEGHHHLWVYGALLVFLAALGFGAWGVWATYFAGGEGSDPTALRRKIERLNQDVATLRRSDQISRDANRDLQRTLAERDEEIAGLRADVAFYERFVGATGQRRGLSVHALEVEPQTGEAWRFVATLTQNLNRGAINSGRLMLSVEGTREGRLQRLAWTQLRQQAGAPGVGYSFKYFEQVEGTFVLPAGFQPLRVSVRLAPEGGAAVEQTFPWSEAVTGATAGAQ